ncbi:MAG: sulfotransferase [Calditrichales bacterium]|nr:sulfotransferase [Calditrichales bacterium]
MNRTKITLLYIGGFSRSGSTILSKILGEIDGFFNVGELLYIWNSMGMCGCGAQISKCKTWNMILDEAFGVPRQVDFEEMVQLRNSEWHSMKIPFWMWRPDARSRLVSNLSIYIKNLEKLYSAIKSVTSARVIVDSSKNPAYAYMLSMIPAVDLHIVHLIRDPRATVCSWLKKKEGLWQTSSWRTAFSWNVRNVMTELLGRKLGRRYLKLYYEEFVAHPRRAVKAILDLAEGNSKEELAFMKADGVELGLNHSVFGNPNRFQSGVVKLRYDDAWKGMRRQDRIIATILAYPLMCKYGYSVFPF